MSPEKTEKAEDRRGLVLVFTGHGKGKTTAAIGQAVRAAAAGLRVAYFQFLKGTWNYSELGLLGDIGRIDVEKMTLGYSWDPGRLEEDKKIATAIWKKVKDRIASGKYDMIVLDDINYLIHYRLIGLRDLLDLLRRRPSTLHVVLTGRNAAPELMDVADEVTEMHDIKHHFRAGVLAQPGIEY